MNRTLYGLPSLLIALTMAPALAHAADIRAPEAAAARQSPAELVQVAQVFTSEEWIGALLTPVKPDPVRGLSVVPGIQVRVQFAFGSAELTEASKTTLDQLGIALTSEQLSRYEFRINGHTDAVGEAPFNLTLSSQRAAAVEEYLSNSFAIDPARLIGVGLGEKVLLNPDDPAASENRRVEIMNVGPAG